MSEIVIIEGPTTDGFDHYAICQCIASLRVEVNTGMRHSRGSVLRLVQYKYGIKARTKKKALAELEDYYENLYGRRYGQ